MSHFDRSFFESEVKSIDMVAFHLEDIVTIILRVLAII